VTKNLDRPKYTCGLEKEMVLNMKEIHQKILGIMGQNSKKYYFLE
jgi:hypothetical protein